MAGGWSSDGAVQDQIDATIDDAVQRARSELPHGDSLKLCVVWWVSITESRSEAIPVVRLCIDCQSERDKQQVNSSGFNSRGSNDSQLR